MKKIFISHHHNDYELAKIVRDFIVDCGVSNNDIFCSSVPGNDVEVNLKKEVRLAISQSIVDIVIITNNYYSSPFCFNEAGVCWFKDLDNNHKTIVFAPNNINPNDMEGFLDNGNILRRFNNTNDWNTVANIISQSLSLTLNHVVVSNAVENAIKSSKSVSNNANKEIKHLIGSNSSGISKLTLNEKAVILYCLIKETTETNGRAIDEWLIGEEIEGISPNKGISLLVKSGYGTKAADFSFSDLFSLDINLFREWVNDSNLKINLAKEVYSKQDLSSVRLEHLINNNPPDILFLFLAYIVDTKTYYFGDRTRIKASEDHFDNWKKEETFIAEELTYSNLLSFLLENSFVYPIDYTSAGNPREYKLHKSLIEYVSRINDEQIISAKKKYSLF